MAIKALNSVAGFSVGEVPANIILANGDITSTNGNFTANISAGNVKTDHLLYANGTAWDLGGTPGGSNTYVQFNDAGEFGGNANFTFDKATSILTVTGNISASNANLGNLVTANFVSGTLTTNAQNNITSVGTLSSLTVTANVGAGNLNTTGIANVGTLTVTGTSNLGPVGNVTITGGSSGYYLQTNGSGVLTWAAVPTGDGISNGTSNVAIPASNGNINLSVNGNANVAIITGTGLVVNGSANVTGNLTAGNIVAGSGTGGNISGADYVTANFFTGTLTTAAQPNITSVGNLTSLTVSGTSNLGPVGNVTITGGSSGYYLQTNGSGVLTWASVPVGTGISNGTSNVSIPVSNGNINLSVDGNANIAVVTGTGVNVAGTLDSTGNITGANLVTTGNIFAPAIVQNASTYDTRISLSSAAGIIEANTNGNATQFLPGGSVRLSAAGSSQIIGGTFDGSGITLGASQTDIYQNRGGNVTVQVGTSGSIANTWTFAQDGSFTSPGNITTSANANVGNLNTGGIVQATGNVNGANFNTTGTANIGNLKIANVVEGNLIPSSSNTYSLGNSTNYWKDLFLSGTTITIGSQTISANVGGIALSNTTYLTTLDVSGNANVGNLGTTGFIVATGNITGGNLMGPLANGNSNVQIASSNGNITLTAVGNTTMTVTGTGANITGTLNATGNANVANLGTTDIIATGSGSFGANVNMNTHWINNVGYPSANTDVATKIYVDTMVSTGIAYHQPVQVATTTTLATATGGTITYNNGTAGVGANLVTTGTFLLIDGANVQTAGTRIMVKDEANAAHNGIYEYTSSTVITRTADADEYGPDSTEQLSINDYFFVQSGTVNEGIAYVVSAPTGTITFGTSNITFAEFSSSQVYDAGTGLSLSGTTFSISNTTVTAASYGNADRIASFTVNSQGQLTAASDVVNAPNAANLTGTTLASSITSASLTSLGTLTSLDVTGNITGGNVYANSGTINALNVGGTLTTAAQPNITSVGTLTSLVVGNVSNNVTITDLGGNGFMTATGNITAPYFIGNIVGNISGNVVIPGSNTGVVFNDGGNANTSTGFTFNKTSNLVTVAGNISGGNLTTGGVVAATGNVSGGNLTTGGVVAATGNVSGGNITTGGAVVATGNVSGGNLTTGGAVVATGNVSGGNLTTTGVAVANSGVQISNSAVYFGNLTTTSITANQTIATLSLSGSYVSGVEYLVKGVDSTGAKYSVATVVAVSDGTTADYSTFATVNLGGATGTLAVNISGSDIVLQVTPASSNSTVWTTQFRVI